MDVMKMIEITLANEIAIEFEWYSAYKPTKYFTVEHIKARAIRKTRLAVFGQPQTGLDRFLT